MVEQLEGLLRLLDQREGLLAELLLAELLLDSMDQQLVPLEALLDQRELPLDQREGLLVLQEQEALLLRLPDQREVLLVLQEQEQEQEQEGQGQGQGQGQEV